MAHHDISAQTMNFSREYWKCFHKTQNMSKPPTIAIVSQDSNIESNNAVFTQIMDHYRDITIIQLLRRW